MTRAVAIACLLIALAPFAFAQEEEKPPESTALPFIQAAQPKLQAQDWKGALADLDKAVAADPGFWRAYYLRALVRQRLQDHKGAIADIDSIFELEPPGDQAWQLYKVRGLSKQDLGLYAEAEEDYTKGINLQTRDPDLFLRRAQVRTYRDDFKGAIADYTSLSGLAPQFQGAYMGRGVAKARLKDFDSAMEDLDAAVYLAETSALVYITRGSVKLFKGDRKGGLADYDKGVQMATDKPHAYFGRGRARVAFGVYKSALADLEEAVKLDPKGQEYAALYRCLARRGAGQVAESRKEMKAYLDQREKKDDWYAKVARFLSGQMIEKDFLAAAAANPSPGLVSQHKCEAYWYAGAVRRIDGDEAKAKEYFKECLATNQYDFVEHESATLALKEQTG